MKSILLAIVLVAAVSAGSLRPSTRPPPLPSLPPSSNLNRARPSYTPPPLIRPSTPISSIENSFEHHSPSIITGSLETIPAETNDRVWSSQIRRRNVRIYSDDEFQLKCLDAMNKKRLWHENTPPLLLGDNFTEYTIERAWSILDDISSGKREIIKGKYPFGESFFWYYDPTRYRSVEEAINTWYEESRHYDYNRPEFSAKTGGFTQLVWKGSREASCVKLELETPQSFKTLVVANFWPAGNVKGEFAQNVLPLRPTRPDLIEQPSSRPNSRPWPRPPYRPRQPPTTEAPSYPTHPLLPHHLVEADNNESSEHIHSSDEQFNEDSERPEF